MNIEKLIKLGNREKMILGGVFGIFGVIVFIFAIINPLLSEAKKASQKIKVAEKEVQRALRVQVRKDDILEQYEKNKNYLSRPRYPDQETIGIFLKELESMAQKSYLSVISLSPAGINEDEYKVYKANFKAEGTLEEILSFFDKIERSGLLIALKKFSISPNDKYSTELTLDAKVIMTIP